MTFEETRRSRVVWRITVELCPRGFVAHSLLDRPAITRQPPENVTNWGRRCLRERRAVREAKGSPTGTHSPQCYEETLFFIGGGTHNVARSCIELLNGDAQTVLDRKTFEGVGEVWRHVGARDAGVEAGASLAGQSIG